MTKVMELGLQHCEHSLLKEYFKAEAVIFADY